MKRILLVLLAAFLLLSLSGCGEDVDVGTLGDLLGIGDAIGGLVDGITQGVGDAIGSLLDGVTQVIKELFIPSEAFFAGFNSEIGAAIDRKTGGLASTFQAIMDEFKRLQDSRAVNNSLKLTMPDNMLYQGYRGVSVNILQGLDGFASWFKGLFSAFLVVITAISCYRKTVKLFKE